MSDIHMLIKLVFHFAVTMMYDTYACVDYKSVYPSRTSNGVNSFLSMYMCVCACVFLHRVFQQNFEFIGYCAGPQLDKHCVCCAQNSALGNSFPVNVLVTFVACMW
jgi:hypothetical protein